MKKHILSLVVLAALSFTACEDPTSSTGLGPTPTPSPVPTPTPAPTAGLPADPTGLSVTANTDTTVSLSWTDNANNEIIYVVQSCTGTGCSSFLDVANSPQSADTTSLTVTGLTEATIYRFRVKATNSYGDSAWLGTGDVTTDPTVVSAPTSFSVTSKGSTSVAFSWVDNATNETSYAVESCAGASCSVFSAVAGSPFAANTTTATVSGLTASSTYRFRVRAASAATTSTYLTSTDITTTPAAPTVLVAGAVTTTSLAFSWTDNASDELLYEIERCTGTGCTGFLPVTSSPDAANTITHTETGLTENTIYRFRVRATSSNGSSAYLTSGDMITAVEPPTGLVATVTDTSITLTWLDNSSSETGYAVEKCTGTGCAGFAAVAASPLAAGSTTHTESGLTAGTIYRFRVKAIGATQNSTYVTSADVTTAPAAPTGFVNGTIAFNSVGFTWTDNATNETNYQVERCTGVGCSSFSVLTAVLPVNTVTYTDSTVSGGTTYKYRVRAGNASGNSDYLVSGNIATPTAPVTPAACTSPNTVVVDAGQKGTNAATTRGLYADVKYIPSGTATGTGAAAGNTIISYSTNVGVAYYDTGALAIKYAYWNGSTFTVETVVGDSVANVFGVRLAYLSNSPNTGIPIIFWASGNGAGNAGQITMAVRSTSSLTSAGTWTVSAVDNSGGATNKAIEVAVSPIDQVMVTYQASTVPAANVARAVICSSSCNLAANYNTMAASQILAATASQLKIGAAWCNRGSGIYNPAVSLGDAAAAKYLICKPAGPTNNLSSCQAAAGWSSINILGTGALVVTDLNIDANITEDVPKALVKDATNVKGYKGNAGCGTAASFATTGGTILGTSVANTGNSYFKFLKHPDYGTPANERYMFMFNDGTTDVKWANTTGADPSNTVWNQAGNAIQTVTLAAAGTTTGGADFNTTTGQMVVAYGIAGATTLNIMLGVVDNYLLAPNAGAQVVYNLPVDSTGHIQLNAAQLANLAMTKTSTNRPAMAYVDFSSGVNTTGKLKYAIRDSATFTGSSWSIQTLPPVGATFSPQFPSIAFDANNKPWIGYFEANTIRYYLATNTQTDGSGTWTQYQFPNAGPHGAPSAAAPAENQTSVAMSYSGGVATPVMIIADTGTTDQIRAARLNPATGVWSSNTQIVALGANGVDSLSSDFSTTSTTVVFSYNDITNTRLRYVVSTDGGVTWSTPTNVSSSGAGMGVGGRIRLNPVSAKPAISYYDRVNGRLFYATCSTAPGSCSSAGNWSGTGSSVLNGLGFTGVAAASENLLTSGLTFSGAGDAYISYISGQLDLGAIRMVDNVGGTMPSGLPTTPIAGANGAFSNAAAINGGIPWSVQTERFPLTGVLGFGYVGAGNNLSYSSCGD